MISIDLSGKCALVTVASQGIGRACPEWRARARAGVALGALTAATRERRELSSSVGVTGALADQAWQKGSAALSGSCVSPS